MKHLIIMTPRELSKYEIVKRLIDKKINGTEAAKQLCLSIRQVRNLKVRVKNFGVKGIIHGSRGRSSNKKISENKTKEMEKFIKDKYRDFGPTFASEKLEENHGIKISKETLRQLMINWELWKPKSRKINKEYRAWRERKEEYGEMIQFDGSYHLWFEDRSPKCCLLASIDDATSQIIKLKFVKDEGVIPIFTFWKEYMVKYGKPLSVYVDRLKTYKQSQKPTFDRPASRTQFQRAIEDELDIKIIYAYSPQAKGRAERLFNTLQDRLIKELRLAKISTIEEANRFVEEIFILKYNAKFAVPPQKKGDLHRPLTKFEEENLDQILSIQKTRTVNNDFTIKYDEIWYQLAEQQPCLVLRKDKVIVEKRIDGSMFIRLKNKYLDYITLPARPEKVKIKKIALTRQKSAWKPPANHPWRNFSLSQKTRVKQPILTN